MKILYVITGLGQGGAERVVCDLADKMYEKGNEVKISVNVSDLDYKAIYKLKEKLKETILMEDTKLM